MQAGAFLMDQRSEVVGSDGNKFIKVTDTPVAALPAGDGIIAGGQQQITNVMVFGLGWLNNNYIEPMAIIMRVANPGCCGGCCRKCLIL
jgi:hypothetical protein